MRKDWRLLGAIICIISSYAIVYKLFNLKLKREFEWETIGPPCAKISAQRKAMGEHLECLSDYVTPTFEIMLAYTWLGVALLSVLLIGWVLWKPKK